MTLREFNLYAKGHSEAHERQMDMLAWHAANVMAASGAKNVSLKRLRPGRFKDTDPLSGLSAMERAREALAMQDERATADWWKENERLSEYIGDSEGSE